MEKKAYVERIMAFITNQQTGRKEEGDEPTPVPPEPESWTIDGVTYYNRCVFDLEELTINNSYDLLSAEVVEQSAYPNMKVWPSYMGGPVLLLGIEQGPGTPIQISLSSYTSRAFTIVETQSEVTDNTKICLPTCSAYYGFLSEGGKTFVSYFNLKD